MIHSFERCSISDPRLTDAVRDHLLNDCGTAQIPDPEDNTQAYLVLADLEDSSQVFIADNPLPRESDKVCGWTLLASFVNDVYWNDALRESFPDVIQEYIVQVLGKQLAAELDEELSKLAPDEIGVVVMNVPEKFLPEPIVYWFGEFLEEKMQAKPKTMTLTWTESRGELILSIQLRYPMVMLEFDEEAMANLLFVTLETTQNLAVEIGMYVNLDGTNLVYVMRLLDAPNGTVEFLKTDDGPDWSETLRNPESEANSYLN